MPLGSCVCHTVAPLCQHPSWFFLKLGFRRHLEANQLPSHIQRGKLLNNPRA